jgi:hypothetical protein
MSTEERLVWTGLVFALSLILCVAGVLVAFS